MTNARSTTALRGRRRMRWASSCALILVAAVAAMLAGPAAGEQASQPTSPEAGYMAIGNFHSCAVHASTVRCWGFGGNGQLGYANTSSVGDDETPGSVGPVDLDPGPGPGTAKAIGAGSVHTCALLDGGTVRCWGFGGNGRLGYGNTRVVGDDETPGSVGPVDLDPGPGPGTAKAISAGNGHTCAILDDGAVRCWGFNLEGRLGYGNTDAIGDDESPGSVGPVDLDPGTGTGTAKAIAAGGFHTCALLDGGAVRCWGFGGNGRLGYGNSNNVGRTAETKPDTVGPVDLDPGPGTGAAKAISAGLGHTCAILENGTVRCWGGGGSGQLGYGNTGNVGDNETPGSVLPVNLGANRTAKAIRAGGEHTCALLDDDSVRCWGYGSFGQLGYGSMDAVGDDETPGSIGPIDLGSGRTAKAISAGDLHTCARLDDDGVRCWGRGSTGRLGYCNERTVGDDERPASAGPVALGPPAGGASCRSAGTLPGTNPAQNGGGTYPLDPRAAEAARLAGLRGCLARVTRHARREVRRARRLSGGRRARARRHARAHRRQMRRRCLKRYGRTPGRVTGLTARATSRKQIVLKFKAPGSDGSRPPAARSYLIKQSRRPIRTGRAFLRAPSLCKGRCSFSNITSVGANLTLNVTGVRRRSTYYFAVAARDNVSKRTGPRSRTVKVRVP